MVTITMTAMMMAIIVTAGTIQFMTIAVMITKTVTIHNTGIVAKYSGKCVACDQRIIAGKDKIAQDDDGDWVHIKCA